MGFQKVREKIDYFRGPRVPPVVKNSYDEAGSLPYFNAEQTQWLLPRILWACERIAHILVKR